MYDFIKYINLSNGFLVNREAKRTLPRPKVGDFCSTAMEQAFSDVCVALCLEERPVNRVSQTCRAAAVEMPRPTVRRWCEHGYNVAFSKTLADLGIYFKSDSKIAEENSQPPVVEPVPESNETEAEQIPDSVIPEVSSSPNMDSKLRGSQSIRPSDTVLATIPVTIEDKAKNLIVYEGQNPEEAVVSFCRENLPDDVSSCIRQLLSTVLDKIASG